MQSVAVGSYDFLVDQMHLTFLVGLIVSYLYFQRRQISVGGSLAVGYLASAAHTPRNILFTVAVSFVAFLVIKYVVLRVWLPRPRVIFAVGLFIGVVCGAVWISVDAWLFGVRENSVQLALIGVIVPGMLCNSLVKQGIGRTLIPLAWMVPLTAAIGFALTWLCSHVLPLSLAGQIFDASHRPVYLAFGVFAASVVFALLIQDGFLKPLGLRTGGYITAGMVVATLLTPFYLVVLVLATAVVWAVYSWFARRAPLFGKDRFLVLCLLSFVAVVVLEAAMVAVTGRRVGGIENLVFCILPAIVANDVVQYGLKRTGGGLAISVAACAAVAVPVYALS